PAPIQPGRRRRRLAPYALALAGLVLIAGVALGLNAILGDGDSGSEAERAAQSGTEEAAPEEEAETLPPATEPETEGEAEPESEPDEIEVTLAPGAEVWACLLDADGEPLVAGEILPAGERVGPFRSRRF